MPTRVLIAEDDTVSRRLLQSYLERWGHEVVAVADGAAAWSSFQDDPCPLVITDWMMPELDGLELVRRIRACQSEDYVYVIMLTGRSQKEDLVAGMEAGADDFISKPFDRDELRVRLREGERIVQLEHELARQNRALRAAQSALSDQEPLLRRGQEVDAAVGELQGCLDRLAAGLAALPIVTVQGLLPELRQARALVARLREPAATS
jgi:DNA-binding response OmpR family regulator